MNEVTIEEKAKIVSKIFAALDIVPKEQKDQLTGIIIGYSMASQFKETKGARNGLDGFIACGLREYSRVSNRF